MASVHKYRERFCVCRLVIGTMLLAAAAATAVNSPETGLIIPSGEIQSYCESDTFSVECRRNEVIVITHARYGRMRQSRCVSDAYGEIGCSANVIDRLDSECSGRRRCDVIVASLAKDKNQPCPMDFRSYLEASYACVTVAFADEALCRRRPGPVELRHESRGFLSNLVAEETGCGSFDSPWWLSGSMMSPGQRIRFTIYEFSSGGVASLSTGQPSANTAVVCRVYAVIKEVETNGGSMPGAIETVCRDPTKRRERLVYTSRGSGLVEVRLSTSSPTGNTKKHHESATSHVANANHSAAASRGEYFIIGFEVVGCPEPVAPRYGWYRRTGDTVVMGCNSTTDLTWRLRCHINRWQGDTPHNCSAGSDVLEFTWTTSSNHSKAISTFLVIGIAVGVGLVILICGMVCLHSRKRRPNRHEHDTFLSTTTPLSGSDTGRAGDPRSSRKQLLIASAADAADAPRSQLARHQHLYSTAEGGDCDAQYDCSVGDIGRFDGDFCGSTTTGGIPEVLSGGNDYFHRQPAAVQGRHMIIGRRLPNLPSAYRSNVGGVYPCHYEPTNCSSSNFPIHHAQVQHPPSAMRSAGQMDSDNDGSVDHVYESPTMPVAACDRMMTTFSGQPEMKIPDAGACVNAESADYFDHVTANR